MANKTAQVFLQIIAFMIKSPFVVAKRLSPANAWRIRRGVKLNRLSVILLPLS
jgi:hypothetical protein